VARAAGVAAVATIAWISAGCPASGRIAAQHAASSPALADPREVAAWVLPYGPSLASLERLGPFLTIVSPTYYRVAFDGNGPRLEDWDPGAPFPRAKLAAIARGARIMPLVGCIGPCGPRISRVLDDPAARGKHVADLLAAAQHDRAAGLFVDYEDLGAAEPSVRAFVGDLASGLHSAGMRLALVIPEPCGVDASCLREPFPFDTRALIDQVDWLVVMEYDFAVDATAPPAPSAWIARGIRKIATDVGDPRKMSKVLCGVPFFGRVSPGIADDTAVLWEDVRPGRVRGAAVDLGPLAFEPEALSKVARVAAGSKQGRIYVEDHETLSARLSFVEDLSVGGIAIWRLGGEDPCNAQVLARFRREPTMPCR
jgi:hypothetical protein